MQIASRIGHIITSECILTVFFASNRGHSMFRLKTERCLLCNFIRVFSILCDKEVTHCTHKNYVKENWAIVPTHRWKYYCPITRPFYSHVNYLLSWDKGEKSTSHIVGIAVTPQGWTENERLRSLTLKKRDYLSRSSFERSRTITVVSYDSVKKCALPRWNMRTYV